MKSFLLVTLLSLTALQNSSNASLLPKPISSILNSSPAPSKPLRNITISFGDVCNFVLDQFDDLPLLDQAGRASDVTHALAGCAQKFQKPVQQFLNTIPNLVQSALWISNEICLNNVDSNLINKLTTLFGDIISIRDQQIFQLPPAPHSIQNGLESFSSSNSTSNSNLQWNIDRISARNSGSFNGSGVTVATIDSGVRVTHLALRNNYRNEFGWFDVLGQTSTPNDQAGHGTHTMGTLAGAANGIGVAPGVKWIACKACSNMTCDELSLKSCAQFLLCPNENGNIVTALTSPFTSVFKKPNCSLIPQVISNSWGGSYSIIFDTSITAWRKSGIIPVFALGNSGSNCNTANSPGNSNQVIGVGSTNIGNYVSTFSSRGDPTKTPIKPDVAGPGEDITSASFYADNLYVTMSGTSMATPAVAGVIALMLSKNPTLTYDQVFKALTGGCDTVNPSGQTCGSVPDSQSPNYESGYGLVNVNKILGLISQP